MSHLMHPIWYRFWGFHGCMLDSAICPTFYFWRLYIRIHQDLMCFRCIKTCQVLLYWRCIEIRQVPTYLERITSKFVVGTLPSQHILTNLTAHQTDIGLPHCPPNIYFPNSLPIQHILAYLTAHPTYTSPPHCPPNIY